MIDIWFKLHIYDIFFFFFRFFPVLIGHYLNKGFLTGGQSSATTAPPPNQPPVEEPTAFDDFIERAEQKKEFEILFIKNPNSKIKIISAVESKNDL